MCAHTWYITTRASLTPTRAGYVTQLISASKRCINCPEEQELEVTDGEIVEGRP